MGRPNKYGGRTIVSSISLPDYIVDWIEKTAKEKGVTKSGFIIACVLKGYENTEEVARLVDKFNQISLVNKTNTENNDYEIKNKYILKAIYQVFNEPNKDNLLVKDRMIKSYKLNSTVEYDIFVTALIDNVKNKIVSYNINIDLEANDKLIKSILETELRKIKVE